MRGSNLRVPLEGMEGSPVIDSRSSGGVPPDERFLVPSCCEFVIDEMNIALVARTCRFDLDFVFDFDLRDFLLGEL